MATMATGETKYKVLFPRSAASISVTFGVRNQGMDEFRARVIRCTDSPILQGFMRRNTENGAMVCADDAGSFGEFSQTAFVADAVGGRLQYKDLSAENGLPKGAQL